MTRFEALLALLKKTKARSVILLCHQNADPDAVCSAFALSKLLEKTMPQARVQMAAPQGISKMSRKILESIPAEVAASQLIEEADAVVLVDTNTLQQLGEWKSRIENSKKTLIVVDHHAAHPETEKVSSLQIVDEHASSTCELIAGLYNEAFVRPDSEEALALFLGMAYDTRHFSIATSNAFKVAAELVDSGVRAEDALPLLAMPLDSSERVARLKAASRLRIEKVGEWLLVLSNVSSHQASAARALINVGAHVSVVAGKKGNKLRINMRSSMEFYLKTKIHLGRDVAEPLSRNFRGMGGGHSTSAGVNGEGEIEPAITECIRLLRQSLSDAGSS